MKKNRRKTSMKIVSVALCMIVFITTLPTTIAMESIEERSDKNFDIPRVLFLIGIVETVSAIIPPAPMVVGFYPIFVLMIGKPLGPHILSNINCGYIDAVGKNMFYGLIIGEDIGNDCAFICGFLFTTTTCYKY